MKTQKVTLSTRAGDMEFVLGPLSLGEIEQYFADLETANQTGTGPRGAWNGMVTVIMQSTLSGGMQGMTDVILRNTVCGLEDLHTLYKMALDVSGLAVAPSKPGEGVAAQESTSNTSGAASPPQESAPSSTLIGSGLLTL